MTPKSSIECRESGSYKSIIKVEKAWPMKSTRLPPTFSKAGWWSVFGLTSKKQPPESLKGTDRFSVAKFELIGLSTWI